MSTAKPNALETDPRFPSGEWKGFYLQPSHTPNHRFPMSLALSFHDGLFTGEGQDAAGPFTLRGRYDLATGDASFQKHYPHYTVSYRGFNEGKGILGVWTFLPPQSDKGGFHIWPKSMPDPTAPRLAEKQPVATEKQPVFLTP